MSLWAIQLKLENNKDFYSNERNTEAQEKRYKRAIKKGRLTYFFFQLMLNIDGDEGKRRSKVKTNKPSMHNF